MKNVDVPRLPRLAVNMIVLTVRLMKSLRFLGLMALAGVGLHGTTDHGSPVLVHDSGSDCSSLGENAVIRSRTRVGGDLGYFCYVSGTFLWLAAGGTWSTSIRVAAPRVRGRRCRLFVLRHERKQPESGHHVTGSLLPASGNDVNFALRANQPSEVRLLGATERRSAVLATPKPARCMPYSTVPTRTPALGASAVALFVHADQAMVTERADLVGLFLFLGPTSGGLVPVVRGGRRRRRYPRGVLR